jgi:hypothetical protein
MFKKIFLGFLIVVLGVALALAVAWKMQGSGYVQQIVVQQVAERVTHNDVESKLLQAALGFGEPQTYLLVFLNNTELRPGGGFIGAYGVVKVDHAVPHILKVEGTELLDNLAPQNFVSVPPPPLKEYLRVDRWNFRDSNWSPDFALSSQKSLELYQKEQGTAAKDIKGIIGFTPTVVEEILKLTGPITVDGQTFDSKNFTEKLEYEVEYGYAQKGKDFDERKKILADLGPVLVDKLKVTAVTHASDYYSLLQRMFQQKQIMAYSLDPATQTVLQKYEYTGEMKEYKTDYLLWADANLGSLKTDAAITRDLTYTLRATSTDAVVAVASMTYHHTGSIDWRTSRYLTYARVFVPKGSKLLGVNSVSSRGVASSTLRADTGEENGRTWFGVPFLVEPKSNAKLEFQYRLPATVSQSIAAGSYELMLQKQLGTLATGLTVAATFGRNVQAALPGEAPKNYGDARYDLVTDLSVDRLFTVVLGQ